MRGRRREGRETVSRALTLRCFLLSSDVGVPFRRLASAAQGDAVRAQKGGRAGDRKGLSAQEHDRCGFGRELRRQLRGRCAGRALCRQ